MKEKQDWEQKISLAMYDKSNAVSVPAIVKCRIDRALDECSQHAGRKEGHFMKRVLIKRWAVGVAVLSLLITTGVYAGGKIAGYCTSMLPDKNYESYDQMEQAQKDAGFTFDSVESFNSGFQMKDMEVSVTDKLDGAGNRISNFKEWTGHYMRGDQDVMIVVSEVQPETEARVPQEEKVIDGIPVSYIKDHYKFVPEDYELTAEDEKNQEGDYYYISVGSDEVEEHDYQSVEWVRDGKNYLIMEMGTSVTTEELFAMAEELIP